MTGVLTTQDNVYLSLTTSLGKDVLILNRFRGEEAFSDLFEFEAEVYEVSAAGDDSAMDFSSILSQSVTIALNFQGNTRYINGIVTQVTQGATVSFSDDASQKIFEKTYYHLIIRPQAWLMTLRQTCRIFQNMTTIDIITQVLSNQNITIQNNVSTAGQDTREFCVQYNESDLAFVSRLMEAVGISYFFQHDSSSHTMVLSDNSTPFASNDAFPTLSAIYHSSKPVSNDPGIFDLKISSQIVSSTYTTQDYNFEQTTINLQASSNNSNGPQEEVYNYPGNYKDQSTGQSIATTRLGSLQFPKDSCEGVTNVPTLEVGKTFTLANCHRTSSNQSYVLFRIYHEGEQSKDLLGECPYTNKIVFFANTQTYVPPLKTPCPKIYGTQTALVQGKAGEEIWTDEYGRIMVKFHWDLSATANDQVSCWIRYSQGWTGQNWGIVFIPRVGQEVVVTFLNGNPDYPLITGCVYNGTNNPPYLPDTPTKSTIKTNSSKGGGGFNELRFEDDKGNEELYMHAEKDMNIDILNGNRTTTLEGAGQTGNDTLLLKKGNRSMTLNQGDETIMLQQGNRSVTLSQGNETTNITGNKSVTTSGDYTLTVGGNLTINVTGAIQIQGQQAATIQATQALSLMGMQVTAQAQTSMTLQGLDLSAIGQASMSLQAPSITSNASASFSVVSQMVSLV